MAIHKGGQALLLSVFLLAAALSLAVPAWAEPVHLDGQYIRDWLLLAPLSPADADAKKDDFPLPVDTLQPMEGAEVSTPSGGQRRWTRFHSESPVLDLGAALADKASASALLFTEVYSDAAVKAGFILATESPLLLGVNGKWASVRNMARAFRLDSTIVRFELHPGLNRVMILFTRGIQAKSKLAIRTLDPNSPTAVSAAVLESTDFGGVFLHPPRIRVRAGDDPAWKESGYDDGAWEAIDGFRFPNNAQPGPDGELTLWFRFPLRLLPDLIGRQVLFECYSHKSSLEIFLNGIQVPGPEMLLPPFNLAPAGFVAHPGDLTVALRWRVTPAVLANEGRDFNLLLRDYGRGLEYYRRGEILERNYAIHRLAIIALFAATLLFHATLFLFYPKRRENLFSALTLLSCLAAMISLHVSEMTTDQAVWHFSYYYLFLGFTVMSVIFGLGLLQITFMGRLARTFYLLAALGLAAYVLALQFGNIYVHAFPLLVIPEGMRVVRQSRVQKRLGTTFLAILSVFLLAAVVFGAVGSIKQWPEQSGFLRYLPWYAFALYIQAMLVLLAREFGGAMRKIEAFAASLEGVVAQRTGELNAEIAVRKRAEQDLTQSLALLRATIESTADGILVIDPEEQILVCNRRLETLWGLPPDWSAPGPAEERHARFWRQAKDPDQAAAALERLFAPAGQSVNEVIPLANGRILDCSGTPYRVDDTQAGRLLVCADDTERSQHEATRERLLNDLREALSQVKTLSGLLPICAWCKKIRDDSGYWSQIEVFIRTHSGAEFSHGICPECAERLSNGEE